MESKEKKEEDGVVGEEHWEDSIPVYDLAQSIIAFGIPSELAVYVERIEWLKHSQVRGCLL